MTKDAALEQSQSTVSAISAGLPHRQSGPEGELPQIDEHGSQLIYQVAEDWLYKEQQCVAIHQGLNLNNLGNIDRLQGHYDQAKTYFQHGLNWPAWPKFMPKAEL